MSNPNMSLIGRLARDTTVLLRILRCAAYELRDRNATVEGRPASITYSTVTRERAA